MRQWVIITGVCNISAVIMSHSGGGGVWGGWEASSLASTPHSSFLIPQLPPTIHVYVVIMCLTTQCSVANHAIYLKANISVCACVCVLQHTTTTIVCHSLLLKSGAKKKLIKLIYQAEKKKNKRRPPEPSMFPTHWVFRILNKSDHHSVSFKTAWSHEKRKKAKVNPEIPISKNNQINRRYFWTKTSTIPGKKTFIIHCEESNSNNRQLAGSFDWKSWKISDVWRMCGRKKREMKGQPRQGHSTLRFH